MKKLIFILLLFISFFSPDLSISQENDFVSDFKNEILNFLEIDKDNSDNYMRSMGILSQNFYKNIQSEYMRKKYIKELNTDLKMDLEKLFLEKKALANEFEKLFNEAASRGLFDESEVIDAVGLLSTFYDNWYNSQLKALEYFNDFALIFDNCEFQYNPDSTTEIFVFYSDKCLNNYNSKLSKMIQQINYDEILRTEFKSKFRGFQKGILYK